MIEELRIEELRIEELGNYIIILVPACAGSHLSAVPGQAGADRSWWPSYYEKER